ncbi:hypothetical protein PGSY75_1118800 [Plasmodium gaboni]|uniref:Actin-related protein 2/3 complex subunit 1 n=1 Tax=Plasmodium gaboni TaxID=647221 RepID=A0A151LIM6_9APIC|nr:hypothetical protein PGSY75_1118800 [Plasmodium gaboni]KYN98828.1 hypothetical protein PGSY75_1118800 [Plasmodium gaboni]
MIDHLKCNCIKYNIPDEDCEPVIKVSENKDDMLVAVSSNKRNILLYKIINKEIIYSDTFFIGDPNKIIALEWSKKNDLLIVTIDMKCIIYKKKEDGKWEYTNVNIPTEDLPTCACWHPHTYSFAIGFTSGIIFICSKKENQKWKIKKITNHVASVMFIEWSSSGYILSTNSLDSTSLLLCTSGLLDDNIKNKNNINIYKNMETFITERNINNNDIIYKIESEGYIFLHSSFSLSNEKIAIIATNFESTYEKQQIIISDYFKSPANIQYVSWVGQTLQRCLFLDDDKLLVYGYEIFPIIVEYLNDEWIISKVVLPEFNIKNLTVDFFYDQKEIQEIEQECEHLDGNQIIGEIVAHSNYILQISMLEPYENKIYIEFITVSSDFSIVLWNFSI